MCGINDLERGPAAFPVRGRWLSSPYLQLCKEYNVLWKVNLKSGFQVAGWEFHMFE